MKKLLLLVATIAIAIGCNKDFEDDYGQMGASSAETTFVTLNLDLEGGSSDSRISVTPGVNESDSWKTAWEEGDVIKVVSIDQQDYKTLTYTNGAFSGEIYVGDNRVYYQGDNYMYCPTTTNWSNIVYIGNSSNINTFDNGGTPMMVSSDLFTAEGSDETTSQEVNMIMKHIGAAVDFGMKFTNIPTNLFFDLVLTSITVDYRDGNLYSAYKTDPTVSADSDGFYSTFTAEPWCVTTDINVTDSDTEYSVQFSVIPNTIENGEVLDVTLGFNNGLISKSFTITNDSGADFEFARATHSYLRNTYDLSDSNISDLWVMNAVAFADQSAGTESDPIEIATEQELAYLSAITYGLVADASTDGVYYKLTNDLDLADNKWAPIGLSTSSFKGYFDGDNHTISNLTIEDSENEGNGLFGYVTGGTISNVNMVDVDFTGYKVNGGIAGYIESSTTITNCSVTGSISGASRSGGIVGTSITSNVTKCYNTATIYNTAGYTGGIVGFSSASSMILNCYNTGTITGESSYVGGIVGCDFSQSYTDTCYNIGTISGKSYVGGIAGSKNTLSLLLSCYNVGEVSANESYVGGIIGNDDDNPGSLFVSYYIVNDSSNFNSFGTQLSTVSELNTYCASANVAYAELKYTVGEGNTLPSLGIGGDEPFTLGESDQWIQSYVAFADNSAGTESDPIEIATEQELAYLAAISNGLVADIASDSLYYKLTADLDLSSKSWTPIGSTEFKGYFDGDNHTISNLTIDNGENSYNGLFGYVIGGSISNVNMVNVDITGYQYNGGIAASIESAVVSNCSVSGSIYGNSSYNGGIVSKSTTSIVTNCYNTATINATANTAGVVGHGDGSIITQCYNTGSVTGTATGGVVGNAASSSGSTYIANCYNMGKITGTGTNTGGIASAIYANCAITSCYNVGEIVFNTDYGYGGGIAGVSYGTITECYYIINGTNELNEYGTQLSSVSGLNAKVEDMNAAAVEAGYSSSFTAGSSNILPSLGIGGDEPFTFGEPSDMEDLDDNGGMGSY